MKFNEIIMDSLEELGKYEARVVRHLRPNEVLTDGHHVYQPVTTEAGDSYVRCIPIESLNRVDDHTWDVNSFGTVWRIETVEDLEAQLNAAKEKNHERKAD